METLTLNCWVRGDVKRISTFEVQISTTQSVPALKEAIKNKKQVAFHDVDANDLAVYVPSDYVHKPYKENLSKIILSEHRELLEDVNELSEVFLESPPKHSIHIIVGMTRSKFAFAIHSDSSSPDAPCLMIVCWLRRATLDARFQVSIRANSTITQLKHCIREAQPSLVHVHDLHIRLYRLSGDDNELQKCLNKTGDGELLQGDTLLPNFLAMPVLNHFYVVAEDASSTRKLTVRSSIGQVFTTNPASVR